MTILTKEKLEEVASWAELSRSKNVTISAHVVGNIARRLLAAEAQLTLAALPIITDKPFMYAIREPDGSAYMDEYCVDLNREHIEGVAASLNETIPTEAPNKYSVVALYAAPSAVPDEVTPDYWVYDTKFGLDISREKPADAENTEPYFPVFKKMLAAISAHQPENTEKSPESDEGASDD
ncbi:hypothetical protein [Dickeya poaceiphila]|uniref:DUF551 domain-containing protein n=1 Tax=Dickeya poaceiphila TaxID=568768 RepID=A0A5B8HP42_9GAMM|nr:hypothetical protein [Dickeya poaceiphila]QDX30925.1 hypothetical protein Dpoa569_0002874 [Dickeya poaceiphila]